MGVDNPNSYQPSLLTLLLFLYVFIVSLPASLRCLFYH